MKFRSLLISSFAIALSSFVVNAADEATTYTTEGYCLYKKAGESTGYLNAYAKKLGVTPSKTVCSSFNDFVNQAQPKDWDYRGGKPYPGSAIRLTPAQIKVLKAANK
jgi:hypothetical protein